MDIRTKLQSRINELTGRRHTIEISKTDVQLIISELDRLNDEIRILRQNPAPTSIILKGGRF